MKKRFKRIYIEITNHCNRSCSFCSKGIKPKRIMNLKEFEHILNEIDDYADYIYLHVKGEPLLHPELNDILNLCKKHNKQVNITTNGTLLKSQVNTLINSTVVRQINVSLHHFKDEPKYIDDILNATDKILENSPIYVNYRFWTLKNNHLTLPMKQMISTIINYYHLSPELLRKVSVQKNVTLKDHLYLDKGDLFVWPSLDLPYYSETGTCHGTCDHLAILCDGTVVPCCLDGDGILSLGNIFEDSFSSILKSDLFRKINQGFKQNKIICELCRKCSYRNRFDHS